LDTDEHRLSRFLNCKITILSVYICENLRPIELDLLCLSAFVANIFGSGLFGLGLCKKVFKHIDLWYFVCHL